MSDQSRNSDMLSELLRPIRLTGVFYSWWHVHAPWSIEGDEEKRAAVLHYVAEGWCWISAEGEVPVKLREGELALFPTGVAHRLSDSPDRRGVPLGTVLADRTPGGSHRIEMDGGGEPSSILCAGLHYDASFASAVYRSLPWIMVLDRDRITADPKLRSIVELLVSHDGSDEPGTGLITLRAFEMAFVLTLHPLLEGALKRSEILAALKQPAISKALMIMYTRFAEAWTIESLAYEVNMSRSAFTTAFREAVGESPASHLSARRMQEAGRLLTDTDVPQNSVPDRIGYKSAVGFYEAFGKYFGVTPGEYRNRHRRQLAAVDDP